MATDLRVAIDAMMAEKNISEDLVLNTIENIMRAAYKSRFGKDDNCIVEFEEDLSAVHVYAERVVVNEENWFDDVTEIPIDEARQLPGAELCEIGDTLKIPVDFNNFSRLSVQSAKQRARQDFRDITKDTLYEEYKNKQDKVIWGYVRRTLYNGDVMIDIGKTEGILPRRFQSPRETYNPNDKVQVFVDTVEKAERGLRVILSRNSPELIRNLFENQIPEIAQNQIEIVNIAREAGYRTKVAVASRNPEIDPVGACVGLKGNRIQTIMTAIDNEKIDVLRYDPNPIAYIANALSPAQVDDVVVIDKNVYQAVAIVDESQLSLAIGKQGLNVRLANKLVDWQIDVKTLAQFREMDVATEARSRAESIFNTDFVETEETEIAPEFVPETEPEFVAQETEEEIPTGIDEDEIDLNELPFGEALIEKLHFHDIYSVEEFIALSDEELSHFDDMSSEDIAEIRKIISENVEFEEEVDDTQYLCPTCSKPVTPDMTVCPSCGTGLSFVEV